MHTTDEFAMETIDAMIFSGDPSGKDMVKLEEYIAGWVRGIASHREAHWELLVKSMLIAIRTYSPKWVGLTDSEILAHFKSGGKP